MNISARDFFLKIIVACEFGHRPAQVLISFTKLQYPTLLLPL